MYQVQCVSVLQYRREGADKNVLLVICVPNLLDCVPGELLAALSEAFQNEDDAGVGQLTGLIGCDWRNDTLQG